MVIEEVEEQHTVVWRVAAGWGLNGGLSQLGEEGGGPHHAFTQHHKTLWQWAAGGKGASLGHVQGGAHRTTCGRQASKQACAVAAPLVAGAPCAASNVGREGGWTGGSTYPADSLQLVRIEGHVEVQAEARWRWGDSVLLRGELTAALPAHTITVVQPEAPRLRAGQVHSAPAAVEAHPPQV